MSDLAANMKEHGIHTTDAAWWIHFHPLDSEGPTARVYWYSVAMMLSWIETEKPPVTIGRSKNAAQTASGAGYLISKKLFFVKSAILESRYFLDFDWWNATQREAGRRGEMIIRALLEDGVIALHRLVSPARSANAQYAGVDGAISWHQQVKWEGKTEIIQYSPNLFVQTRERGHQPNYTRDGVKRETAMPMLDDVEF